MSALSISAMLPVDALAQSRAEKTEGQLETVEDVAGLTDLSFDELRGKDLSGVNDAMMRPAPSAVRQPRTRAYPGKVLGTAFMDTPHPATQRRGGGDRPSNPMAYEDIATISDLSFDEIRSIRPSDIKDGLIENRPRRSDRTPRTRADREAATIRGLTEGRGITGGATIGDSLNSAAVAATTAQQQTREAEVAQARSYSFGDKFGAAFEDTTITSAILRQLDREVEPFDLNFVRDYANNRQELEKGYAWEEVRRLRRANSQADFDRIAGEIAEGRERKAVYMSGGSGKWYSIFVHALDPVVWLALAALLSASIFAGRCRRRLKVPSGN
ncbi:hypothetical protein [Brevundimonas diminuta]|uniref:hypothetical protein n=1 Tax=Brevundimonas diminuta TaxID=293 RepID=UPI000B3638DF|nr:hypothetical protein [Brevundimonas diminuta]